MTSLVRSSLAAAAALVLAGPVSGQAIQASQSATVSQWIADAHFEIALDRPVARDREIWGALVPWNEVWTPSANLALQLRVNRGVLLAGQSLPAGAYSVWLEPKESGAWRLLVHRELEVAHNVVPSDGWVLEAAIEPRRDADHMEALAAYFSDADYREGALDLHWGTTALRIPIEVPEGG